MDDYLVLPSFYSNPNLSFESIIEERSTGPYTRYFSFCVNSFVTISICVILISTPAVSSGAQFACPETPFAQRKLLNYHAAYFEAEPNQSTKWVMHFLSLNSILERQNL